MWAILDCIRDEHDLGMVCLAAMVCVLSSFTAMRFYRRVTGAGPTAGRLGWAALTGAAAGSGVWATHFVAMLAYHPGLPIRFAEFETTMSLVVVVAGMSSGFALAGLAPRRFGYLFGGALIGLSIPAMHFMGIAAMQAVFNIDWRWGYVAASVAWSVAGSVATLIAARRVQGMAAWFVPAAVLVATVVGLHFTAMTAMTTVPDLTSPITPELLGRKGMAALVGAITCLIVATAGALAAIEAHGRRVGILNLDRAFQGVQSGMALFSPDGRLVLWNEAYERMVAIIEMKPFVGATRYDLLRQMAPTAKVAPEDSDVWARRKAMQRASGLMQEWPTPAGGWYRTELSTLADGSTITVLTDITAQKTATIAMAEARDRAEAANRAKSEFLTNMSHEIRTPLNGVLGMAQVIEADELTPIQRERVQVVRESGQALLAILNDLLDLSKVQAGKLELEIGEVDVDHLARTVISAFDGAAAARDLTLSVEIASEAQGLWRGDALRLRQVLSNLVGNALKFTHKGGVTLTVDAHDEGLTFSIRDTGIGIKAEALEHLFDAFTQADASTTRRYGGTGLGLSISRDLVALMDGTITVTSELGQGSCFTVHLPTQWIAPVRAEQVQATASARDDDRLLRILAAEDNATNRLVLRSLLAPTGCDLVIVENGRQAVEAAASGGFDLILMDVQMPEMNGVEATIAIRTAELANGRRPTPIIALSANVMSHQIREYADAGMNHWIAKPIEVDKLYACLDLVLSEAEEAARAAA